MNISTLVLVISVIVLAALGIVLSAPAVREKMIGQSRLRTALIPLFAGAVVWLLQAVAGFMADRVADESAPGNNLTAFIQSVTFAYPRVPSTFQSTLLPSQIEDELKPFRDDVQKVRLTAMEIEELNAIEKRSGMLRHISGGPIFKISQVGEYLEPPFAFYGRYQAWTVASRSFVAPLRQSPSAATPAEKYRLLTSTVESVDSLPGLLQAIVGIHYRRHIALSPMQEDCLQGHDSEIPLVSEGNALYLNFQTFKAHLYSGTEPGRVASARALGNLFESACLLTLARVFEDAAKVMEVETDLMGRYLRKWDDLLANKQPESMRIGVQISNIGKYDSFVRREGKVSVGSKGSDAPIEVMVKARSGASGESAQEDAERSIKIASRSNEYVTFDVELPDLSKQQLFGAYKSGLVYVRLGLLASAGSNEENVLTQIAPFSTGAKEEYAARLLKVRVPL